MTARAMMIPFHPLTDLFPPLDGVEFGELVADVGAHGLREPITTYDEKILDGRNRYRACLAAGIEPVFVPYGGKDPVAYVISANLRRRHLNEGQRAMLAAKLATLRDGQRQVGKFAEVPTQGEAATLLNVSERSIRHARDVHKRGAPELISAVERGKVSVSAAADVAELPQDQQCEIVARGEKEILAVAKEIRARGNAKRRAEWEARAVQLANAAAPLPRDRRYPILLADPPWPFAAYAAESGLARSAESHYPTLSIKEICTLPVANLATPDAALFLWTTAPHLPNGLRVMDAWGFTYRTNIVWVKDAIGLGYWVRNQHELLLIGAGGEMRAPAVGARRPSVIKSPRREHSRKPDEAYEFIETMYPGLPRVELFARSARLGWDAWGNEMVEAAE
jgi:N6-adenosine-specific RNA methylase IME4